MKKIFWLLPIALVLPALAVIPQFWETRTYDQFRRGDLTGLSVTGDGQLMLAPSFDLVFGTPDPIIFSAVTDRAGNVYLGTGHNGKVYKVDDGGNGSVLADLEELDVLALALGDDDALFAATSPNGKVYRITSDGDTNVFFEPEARYIWSMVFDREGRLLVATGDEGVIYRVDNDGESEIFYDSEETHIITMALDGGGNVIAGGDPKGYVYRISGGGQPFVLYDSGMREVRSVVVADDGTIYAAVLDSPDGPGLGGPDRSLTQGRGQGPAVSITVGAEQGAFAAQNGNGQGNAGAANAGGRGRGNARVGGGNANGGAQSVILQITPDGAVSRIWESDDEMVFALLPGPDRLLFSTGTEGRIYSLQTPELPTLLLESTEEQTTRLLARGDRIFATSSNAGKLFEIGDTPAASGSYESIVRNTGAISNWGKASWTGDGVEILTRSGNTESPDQTWSDWAALTVDGGVTSPRARFVQWRAVLTSNGNANPKLSSVTLPYLQQNFRPEVSEINVLRPGIALQALPTGNNNAVTGNAINRSGVSGRVLPTTPRPNARNVLRPGAQSLRWTARDENNDVLIYSLLYRAGNEGEWKELETDITESYYTVRPDTLPDGTYVFRVVASDVGSNPPGRALTGQMETRPFAMDNTPPGVTVEQRGLERGQVNLYVDASDETSTLKQAEVSVDAGQWRPVFPVDGIVDSQSEIFEFSSLELDSGEHVVAFRIYDQNDNVGIGKAIVQIP